LTALAAGHGADDEERFLALDDPVGQWRIRRLVGKVLLACEEPDKRAAISALAVADRSAQHRILGLQNVEHHALGDRPGHLEPYLARDPGEVLQVCG